MDHGPAMDQPWSRSSPGAALEQPWSSPGEPQIDRFTDPTVWGLGQIQKTTVDNAPLEQPWSSHGAAMEQPWSSHGEPQNRGWHLPQLGTEQKMVLNRLCAGTDLQNGLKWLRRAGTDLQNGLKWLRRAGTKQQNGLKQPSCRHGSPKWS